VNKKEKKEFEELKKKVAELEKNLKELRKEFSRHKRNDPNLLIGF